MILRLIKTLWQIVSIWSKLNDSQRPVKNHLDMEEQNLNALEFHKSLLLTLLKAWSKHQQLLEPDLHQKDTKNYQTSEASQTCWFKVFQRQRLENLLKLKWQRSQKLNLKIRNLDMLNRIWAFQRKRRKGIIEVLVILIIILTLTTLSLANQTRCQQNKQNS